MRMPCSVFVVFTLFAVGGCGDDGGPANVDQVQLNGPAVILLGGVGVVTARVMDDGGSALDGRSLTWSSSDAATLEVRSEGERARVRALRPGEADVVASINGKTALHRVRMHNPTPMVDSILPRRVPQAAGDIAVRAFGRGFQAATQLYANGAVQTTEVIGDSELRLTLPASMTAQAGRIALTAATPSPGGGTSAEHFIDVAPDVCAAARPIQLGEQVNGALVSTACRLGDGTFADVYGITLTETTRLQLDMTSTVFDTYLYVLAGSALIAEDDDSGGDLNARVNVTLQPGTYHILASTFEPGRTGAYQLRASTTDPCLAEQLPINLAVGGFLTQASCTSDGFLRDNWSFTLTQPTAVRIELSSIGGTFRPALTVTAAGAATPQLTSAAPSGSSTLTLEDHTLPAGNWTASVTTANAGETGQYRLDFNVPGHPCATTHTIAVPEVRTGTLTTTSCQMMDGSPVDLWAFTLTAPAQVTINMTSSAFNAYLLLANNGVVIGEDDNGGGGSNARITKALAAGTYVVVANAYAAGQTGSYQLSVQATAPLAAVRRGGTFSLPPRAAKAGSAALKRIGQ